MDGRFKVDLRERGEFISKIDNIVESVLREMIELPYKKVV